MFADYWDSHMMGGGWGWMVVLTVLLVVTAALIAWAVARGMQSRRPAGVRSPQDILAERYARGEIEREEYDERLRNLR